MNGRPPHLLDEEATSLIGRCEEHCLDTGGPVYGDFTVLKGLVSKIMGLFFKALAIALNPLLLLL
jgi:hypothetical protein